MKRLIHALIIARNVDTMMSVASVAVEVAATPENEEQKQPMLQPAEAPAWTGGEIENDTAPFKDMRRQAVEGVILHQCPHLLINAARWLIHPGTKGIERPRCPKLQARKTQTWKVRVRRWVVIHHKFIPKKYYSNLLLQYRIPFSSCSSCIFDANLGHL